MRRKKHRRRLQPLNLSTNLFLNWHKIRPIVMKETKRKKDIIYGARAMNAQVPGIIGRTTWDFDIYTKKPRKSAHKMQRKLDRKVAGGRDDFYAKRAKHRKTHRVMHEGPDQRQNTKDDIPVVDYTLIPRGIKTITIAGIRFERLSSIKKVKRKILRDPKSKYRHQKDRDDLAKMRVAKMLRERR